MEMKLTERDKMLLIILVIMVIVFGAVMIPSYGIMASINSIKEDNAAIKAQKAENESAMEELIDKGVDSGYVESPINARRKVEENILAAQYDAVKMSQMSLSADSTSVARDWLLPVAYVGYENGTEAEKLLKDIAISSQQGYTQSNLDIEGYLYMTNSYPCVLTCSVVNPSYEYQTKYMEDSNVQLCDWVVALNVLAERGSVHFATGSAAWTFADEDSMLWTLDLAIPQDSKIEQYKHLLGECHQCGHYYSIAEYQEYEANEMEMHCVECEGVLTGDTIR